MNIQIVAKRYAGALFGDVKGKQDASKIWEELSALSELVRVSPEFANIVKNPLITNEEKRAVFSALKSGGKISGTLFNFLSLLIDKKRLFLLNEIDAEIKRLILKENGEMEAEAVFAVEPGETAKDELRKKLSSITGKSVLLKGTVDPRIIGGVKVRLGSVLYDASIRGQLDKLKAGLV